ncbi:MAG TPA: hypothetical protein VKR06_21210, partial [Ktedonosporobacter sp.]|nr:hypothetical protein [Ktedonosporobacter sp.]
CRVNVFAANGAFTGGQSAREYQMITQADIDQAVTSIKTSLTQSVQAAYQAQVKADETLITPVSCQPKTTTDKKAGDEGSEVTVTVDESCSGETYKTEAMQTLLKQITDQQAMSGYQLRGDLQLQVIPKGKQLEVKAIGEYVYPFTQTQFDQISKQIAGKSESQARAILLHTPGIGSVSLDTTGKLPTDPEAIRFIVIQK